MIHSQGILGRVKGLAVRGCEGVLHCATRRSTQEMTHQQTSLDKTRTKKKKRKRKKKVCKKSKCSKWSGNGCNCGRGWSNTTKRSVCVPGIARVLSPLVWLVCVTDWWSLAFPARPQLLLIMYIMRDKFPFSSGIKQKRTDVVRRVFTRVLCEAAWVSTPLLCLAPNGAIDVPCLVAGLVAEQLRSPVLSGFWLAFVAKHSLIFVLGCPSPVI